MMTSPTSLAELTKSKKALDARISAVIGRPIMTGHLGEYIASEVFNIVMEESPSLVSSDGHFPSGPLAGHSVNVKYYPKHRETLDIPLKKLPDYMLVLAGPESAVTCSQGFPHPHVVESVFLFEAGALVAEIGAGNVKPGEPTRVKPPVWRQAEIYPLQRNGDLVLSEEQRNMLALFSPANCPGR